MIARPVGMGAFEFVVLSTLRAAQLMRGCRPTIGGDHKSTIVAQLEVANGTIMNMHGAEVPIGSLAGELPEAELAVVDAAMEHPVG